jgi:hypothetical protein
LQFMAHVILFSMLNVLYFEMVPVAPIITGITFLFTFYCAIFIW